MQTFQSIYRIELYCIKYTRRPQPEKKIYSQDKLATLLDSRIACVNFKRDANTYTHIIMQMCMWYKPFLCRQKKTTNMSRWARKEVCICLCFICYDVVSCGAAGRQRRFYVLFINSRKLTNALVLYRCMHFVLR